MDRKLKIGDSSIEVTVGEIKIISNEIKIESAGTPSKVETTKHQQNRD